MRFAVLHHSGAEEGDHFDFLIELELGKGDLLTFRLPVWPAEGVADVKRLRDHRRIYLTYEGDVSGGRGTVNRIDEGDAELESTGGIIFISLPNGRRLEFHPDHDDIWTLRAT